MKLSEADEYETPHQAAARRKVAASTIYDAIRNKTLASEEKLGKTVVRRSDVDAYPLRPNKRRAEPEP